MDDIYNSFNEKHVQQIAHDFLIQDYEIANATNKGIYEKMEAYTVNDNRADGFLAIRTGSDSIFTSSLECKRDLSSSSLRWVIHPRRLIYVIFVLSMLIMIVFFSFYFWFNEMAGFYVEPLIVGLTLTVFTAIYIGFERYFNKNEPSFLKTRAVYLQLEKYPADEKWLAFSMPLNEREETMLNNLYRECKNRGYGLLTVDVYTEKVRKRIQPKSYRNRISNNLKQYKDKKEIENYLMIENIPNWKGRRKTRGQIYYFVRNAAIIIFLIVATIWLRAFFFFFQTPMATTIEPLQQQEIKQQEEEIMIEQIEEEVEPIIASTTVILDNVYDNLASAEWRIKTLNELDLEAKVGQIDDYQIDLDIDKNYFVFLDDEKGELKLLYNDYREKLFNAGVDVIEAKIIEIEDINLNK
ncbi:MAG: hypothetical protein AB8G11_10775 [Saprospiraceae bacterium]